MQNFVTDPSRSAYDRGGGVDEAGAFTTQHQARHAGVGDCSQT